MSQCTFSFSKFNLIFLPKLLLMCLPGTVFIVIIICALNGKLSAISSSRGAAIIASAIMLLSMAILVLAFPYYLSRLSQYRNSYIVKQENEITYYKCADNIPILDEKTKIYEAKDITRVYIVNRTIYIYGSIKEIHRTRHGNECIGEIEELIIPDVFYNTDILIERKN